jgi:choline dehydrogenase-like flavoprotein
VQNSETFDYIIVGAGSAGCVLANRLTASGRHRVLLLEAGPNNRHPWLHIPLGFGRLFNNRRFNWCYETEPQPECHNRRVIAPAWQGSWWIQFDQWTDLYPRPSG